MFKRYFYSYKFKDHKNNELLAFRKAQYGAFEVVAWQDQFELFYRPYRKRYGYFIRHYAELDKAVTVMKTLNETDLTKQFINIE